MSTHTVVIVLTAPGNEMHPAAADGSVTEIEQVIRSAAEQEISSRVAQGLLPEGCGVQ